jgi:hypothetical protein
LNFLEFFFLFFLVPLFSVAFFTLVFLRPWALDDC